jgi:FdhD protein
MSTITPNIIPSIRIKMPEKYTISYPAKRIHSNGRAEDTEILLAKECPVKLYLNGKICTTLFASPLELKELAIGHLVTEGAVNFREITEIEVTDYEINILTQNENQPSQRKELDSRVFVDSNTVFEPEALFAGTSHLESEIYRLTRGTHLAALIDTKRKLAVQIVDVGRHNAIDKAVGFALFHGLDISQFYLLSTGRQPGYMVTKAARAGIPLIATKAMPFDSGVEAAKKANVCLVGQLRKESMLIFANEWRIRL